MSEKVCSVRTVDLLKLRQGDSVYRPQSGSGRHGCNLLSFFLRKKIRFLFFFVYLFLFTVCLFLVLVFFFVSGYGMCVNYLTFVVCSNFVKRVN